MPEADQEHGGIPLAVAVALGGFDQLLDLAFGQVFAWTKLAVRAAGRRNCPFYCCWGHQFEARFGHMDQALVLRDCPYTLKKTDSCQLTTASIVEVVLRAR